MDPSVSVPTATAHKLAAMAAPEPELEPQGLRSNTYGFFVCPPGIFHVAVKDEFKTTDQIKVNSNPVIDKLSVHIPDALGKLESLQVLSITGQILLTINYSNGIDPNSLSPGIYFIHAQFENGRKAIAKFIKR